MEDYVSIILNKEKSGQKIRSGCRELRHGTEQEGGINEIHRAFCFNSVKHA